MTQNIILPTCIINVVGQNDVTTDRQNIINAWNTGVARGDSPVILNLVGDFLLDNSINFPTSTQVISDCEATVTITISTGNVKSGIFNFGVNSTPAEVNNYGPVPVGFACLPVTGLPAAAPGDLIQFMGNPDEFTVGDTNYSILAVPAPTTNGVTVTGDASGLDGLTTNIYSFLPDGEFISAQNITNAVFSGGETALTFALNLPTAPVAGHVILKAPGTRRGDPMIVSARTASDICFTSTAREELTNAAYRYIPISNANSGVRGITFVNANPTNVVHMFSFNNLRNFFVEDCVAEQDIGGGIFSKCHSGNIEHVEIKGGSRGLNLTGGIIGILLADGSASIEVNDLSVAYVANGIDSSGSYGWCRNKSLVIHHSKIGPSQLSPVRTHAQGGLLVHHCEVYSDGRLSTDQKGGINMEGSFNEAHFNTVWVGIGGTGAIDLTNGKYSIASDNKVYTKGAAMGLNNTESCQILDNTIYSWGFDGPPDFHGGIGSNRPNPNAIIQGNIFDGSAAPGEFSPVSFAGPQVSSTIYKNNIAINCKPFTFLGGVTDVQIGGVSTNTNV